MRVNNTKICKSKTGLKRHVTRKHPTNDPLVLWDVDDHLSTHKYNVTTEKVLLIFTKTSQKILDSGLYPDEVKDKLRTFLPSEEVVLFLTEEINKLKVKNLEDLYTSFYNVF